MELDFWSQVWRIITVTGVPNMESVHLDFLGPIHRPQEQGKKVEIFIVDYPAEPFIAAQQQTSGNKSVTPSLAHGTEGYAVTIPLILEIDAKN